MKINIVVKRNQDLYIVKECTDLNALNRISFALKRLAIDLIFKGAVFLGDGTELYLVIDLYSIIEQKFVRLKLKF